jgi:hypothetical protein
MSTVPSLRSRVKPSRKPETRSLRLTTIGTADVLWLTVGKLTTAYKLTRLPSDFGAAYRLDKAIQGDGQEESYDVCLLEGGRSSCECKGHLRHKTECKHIAALALLVKQGRLDGPKAEHQPARRQPWCCRCNDDPSVFCSECSL